jgi:hypothetical protein
MDNVQNCGSYINIPSSQTYRSWKVTAVRREAYHSRQSIAELKKWSCTQILIQLDGVEFNYLQF